MIRGKPQPFQRKDGMYVAQVSEGPRGARKIVRVYRRDRAEAVAELEKLLDARRLPDGGTTVGRYLERWLDVNAAAYRPSTLETYRIAVRRQLVPALGHIALRDLRPEHVEAMIADLARTMTPKGIRNAVTLLRQVLDEAEARDYVRRNVARLVKPPRLPRRQRQAVTVEDVRALLAAVRGDRLEALYVVTIAAGLRQSEVLGLRWQDIDLDRSLLRVANTLERVDGEYRLAETKTKGSERTVVLPPFAVKALREHRLRQLEERAAAGIPTSEGLVFVAPTGRPLSASWLSHRWPDHAKAAGVAVTFHGLRHAQATLLVALGAAPRTIADRLGHSAVGTTLDIYTGTARSSDAALADMLEEALG